MTKEEILALIDSMENIYTRQLELEDSVGEDIAYCAPIDVFRSGYDLALEEVYKVVEEKFNETRL